MSEIIGVKFKGSGKSYYFDPRGQKIAVGQRVIVETAQGVECGTCTITNSEIEDDGEREIKKIIRVANEEDKKRLSDNIRRQDEAFHICCRKIEKHKLEMKLVEVEYTFDGSKILFYYTADGRVDFRELVKDLASVFRARIEMRQVGARDEAKMLGGLGLCGREFCCKSFIREFAPVSIKMAKEQNLSLNPAKISGTCGRLMCCLKYEQDVYEYLRKITPRQGNVVETPEGTGVVENADLLTGKIKVKLDSAQEVLPSVFNRDEIKRKNAPPVPAEPVQRTQPPVKKPVKIQDALLSSEPTDAKKSADDGKAPKKPNDTKQQNRRPYKPKKHTGGASDGTLHENRHFNKQFSKQTPRNSARNEKDQIAEPQKEE